MRAPSNAPAVRYPYGRSQRVGRVIAALAMAGLACTAAWLQWGGGNTGLGLKAAVGLGLWIVCVALAWRFWRRLPSGLVAWDGGRWELADGNPGQSRILSAAPQVHLDLQACMLLSARIADDGPHRWLWLEQRSDAALWTALRCAVFASVRSADSAPGIEEMAAAAEPEAASDANIPAAASALAAADTIHGLPSRSGAPPTKT